MKRCFLYVLAVVIVLTAGVCLVSAETVTLTEHMAKAVSSAVILDANNRKITATLASSDNSGDVTYTVSLDADASSAASINFDGADLDGITSNDFPSFDKYFTGLETVRLALPASYSGEFALSLDKLSKLDMSGSTADFTLSVYAFPKIESLKADNCVKLKAVNLAVVEPKSSGGGMGGMFGGGGDSESRLATSPLAKLSAIDLSNNPALDRVGYLLSSDSSSGIPGMGGSSGPKLSGYKAHSVITTVKNTTYYPEDTSNPKGEASSNPLESLMGGGGGDSSPDLGSYSGKTVNLVPSLTTLALTNSGKGEEDYISFIDISDAGVLATAELSGMTKLVTITLPVGTALKTLNLTGDTALAALDLSGTMGFVWPEGFKTLTGLQRFTMSDREDVTSVDISGFLALKELSMMNDELSALDFSVNKSLERLNVANNKITSLDFTGHTKFTNIDVRNNALTKIELSRNTNIRVNKNSPADSVVSLSGQTRKMTTARSKRFRFSDAGLKAGEFGNVVAESVKGDGTPAVSFDSDAGMATFGNLPLEITYDYKSGVFYEGTTEPVCMNVKLTWDVSADVEPISEDIGPQPGGVSGSSGGCEAFGLSVAGLALVFLTMKKR